MKKICYQILVERNKGTEESPEMVRELYQKGIEYNQDNLTLAEKESYNGEYTIEDDGQPEPVVEPTESERIAELEEALTLLLSGVTE